MPDKKSEPPSTPQPCKRCGGILELLTKLPRADDHPAYRIFACAACGSLGIHGRLRRNPQPNRKRFRFRVAALCEAQHFSLVGRGVEMPIRGFFDDHTTFEPETLQSMGKALTAVLTALRLTDKSDDLTVLVAQKIIELAKAGEHDAERLRAATLKEFSQQSGHSAQQAGREGGSR